MTVLPKGFINPEDNEVADLKRDVVDYFQSLLKPKKLLKIGPSIDDKSKWCIYGGNGGNPHYLEVVDRESFDSLKNFTIEAEKYLTEFEEFIKGANLEGSFEVFKQLKNKEF